MVEKFKCSCGKEFEIKEGWVKCPYCRRPLSAGLMTCPKCKTEFPADSMACPKCDYPVKEQQAELIRKTWRMQLDDLAARFDEEDIEGTFIKGVIIEQGTKALFIQDGQFKDELSPGQYPVGGILPKLKDFSFRKRCSVIIVKTSDVPIPFSVENIFTKTKQRIGIDCEITLNISEPNLFFVNLFQQRDRYTTSDLAQYLSGEIKNAFQTVMAEIPIEELYYNKPFKTRLATTVELESKVTLERKGLSIIQLRVIDYHSPEYDKLRERMGEQYMGAKWNEVEKAIRGLITADNLDKWESEVDFENAVRKKEMEFFRDEVIREEEMEELKRIFRFHKENAELMQRQTIDRLVNEFRRKQNTLDVLTEEEQKTIKNEEELKRKLSATKTDVDIARLKHEIEKMEDEWDLILMERRNALESKSTQEQAEWLIRYQKEVNFNPQVMRTLMLKTLKGDQLAGYLQLETLQILGSNATPEQLLAAIAERRPEVIEAFKDKWKLDPQKIEKMYIDFLEKMTSVATNAVTNKIILTQGLPGVLSPGSPIVIKP